VGNLQRTQRRFLRPKPDTAEYATKALATAKAVREAEPSATIIASAMPGFDWKYMKNFLQSGVLELFGGVSVHPYRPPNRPPDTAVAHYKRLSLSQPNWIGMCFAGPLETCFRTMSVKSPAPPAEAHKSAFWRQIISRLDRMLACFKTFIAACQSSFSSAAKWILLSP
jgi:hypothetical protein